MVNKKFIKQKLSDFNKKGTGKIDIPLTLCVHNLDDKCVKTKTDIQEKDIGLKNISNISELLTSYKTTINGTSLCISDTDYNGCINAPNIINNTSNNSYNTTTQSNNSYNSYNTINTETFLDYDGTDKEVLKNKKIILESIIFVCVYIILNLKCLKTNVYYKTLIFLVIYFIFHLIIKNFNS